MMRRLTYILLCLALAVPSWAALPSDTVWEARQPGDDQNGGCFDTGASGTDRSQQDAAQITYTDLVVGANPNNEDVTSVLNPFTSAEIGNCIRVNSGAGCNVGYYVVLSVAGVIATTDRDVGTAASVCAGNLGGAVAGTGAWDFCGSVVAGNTIHVRYNATSYTHTATLCAITIDGTALLSVTWQGYQTTRGDDTGTRPILTSATNSIALITVNGADYQVLRNLKCTHTAATRGTCINFVTAASAAPLMDNIWCDGTLYCVDTNSASPTHAYYTNLTSENTTNSALRLAGNVNHYLFNVVLRNAGNGAGSIPGITTVGTQQLYFDYVTVSGSSSHGFHFTQTTAVFRVKCSFCVSEGNTGDGVRFDSTTGVPTFWWNDNIAYGNGGYGVNFTTVTSYLPDVITFINRNNAYGSNTSGARNNLTAGTGDVTLTAAPFTAGGSGKDWDLNSTAGGGAALKGVGFPGAVGATGSTSTTGFPDIGVSQHPDAGGATTILIPPVVVY